MSVAIVGKPNVGKSSLFNRLIKKSKSIVLDQPGITRDRVFGYGKIDDKEVLFCDTGGFSLDSNLGNAINEQIKIAIDSSDVVIIVFDITTPVSDYDLQLFNYVQRIKKSYILVVNKADVVKNNFLEDYYRFGEFLSISVAHGKNINGLQKLLKTYISVKEEEDTYAAKIAIIGRPNVGKSSILNAILKEKRSIVDDKVGTTRDSVDSVYAYNKRKYLIIDTAGIRRMRIDKSIEKLSSIFAVFAIERCNIAILVIDASYGVTSLDKKIMKIIEQKHKSIIIVLNKWDLVNNKNEYNKYIKSIREKFFSTNHIPIIITSATEKKNINSLLKEIESLNLRYSQRISTSVLNNDLQKIIKSNMPFSKNNKEVKIKYITQIATRPPHFVIFTNRPDLVVKSYRRYINNSLHRLYDFNGCFLKVSYRKTKDGPPGNSFKN